MGRHNRGFTKILAGNRGGLIIFVLLVVFATLAIAAIVVPIVFGNIRALQPTNEKASLEIIADNLNTILKNDKAWLSTVNDPQNTSFACLVNSTDCSSVSGTDSFKINDPSGVVFYKAADPKAGFSYGGVSCTISSPQGDDRCPFRFVITWRPICSATPCSPPSSILIQAKLQYKPAASRVSLKESNFDFSIVR
jgi:hypothetical protein